MLLSQLDDFHRDIMIGNPARERGENIMVKESTIDRDFSVGTSGSNLTTKENPVKVKTLQRCFNEKIDWEMSNIVDTVEDKIQKASFTAIDNIVAPEIELAIK